MKKIVKRLELKRETVRTLAAKSGLRAGLDTALKSIKTGPDTGTAPGMTGTNDAISNADPHVKVVAEPTMMPPGQLPALFD